MTASDFEFIGARLVATPGQLLRLQRVASGAEPADPAIRDGVVLPLPDARGMSSGGAARREAAGLGEIAGYGVVQ